MHKKWLAVVSLLFSISLALSFSFFALSGDILFFMSDARSITTIILTLTPVFLVVLAAVGLALRIVVKSTEGTISALQTLLAALLAATPIFLGLALIDSAFLLTVRGKYLLFKFTSFAYPEFLWVIFWPLLLAFFWMCITRSRTRDDILKRTQTAANWVMPFTLALAALALAMPPTGHSGQPKRLVLIILDGWPTSLSPTFATGAPSLPSSLPKARVFTNVRSNAVWTNGYFGILYRGKQSDTFSYLDPYKMVIEDAMDADPNLINELQKRDVAVRGIFYHRNGMPENSSGRVTAYSGFRSLFALPHHSGLLDKLGLDYFIVTRGPTLEANLGNDIRPWLISRTVPGLAPRKVRGSVFNSLLIPEMEKLARKSARSALIFHYSWATGSADLPVAWDSDELEVKGSIGRARNNGYRYPPEDETLVTSIREHSRQVAASLEDNLARFLDEAREKGLLDDTLVLITADHGTSYADGRLWYGYHPQETVAKTPVLFFGDVMPGIDDRPAETIDVTQTILNYFAPGATINPLASDLLAAPVKQTTFTFTQPSDIAREWFVTVYRNQTKTTCNIHPKGDGKCVEFELDNYRETPTKERLGPDDFLKEELALCFGEFGINRLGKDKVHAAFRDLLGQGSGSR
ncbi:MAG: alkaline phosphatase family protein [Pseudodesulfovibrio sp.]|uniref:Sulfatase n=1 Tax=Pseudodesulfovibrio aespoeensis (strain ATCC 700646 / DSM 10631 / Aspo-2) TaxID=643562 RepID=E6VR50_PSEA9|nr:MULTISPECIES: sulfatase-like hydrolase/transferase [Pseudodesulfovibrio]MBU4379052.1 alkaline phosphatase family protein [Pseudomonadota bacterium]ADU64134.1 sulfatase [Pseudodesulfovibrio aespoeensis Aspo-2]MBU4475454.1 alkaline phosphatase family protein [Pseudomonadota bacterium]MBU4521358.1 alkaline phosphatase family protein [Pseudomonadota bacterium]MBU4558463.1 alkaline phosphatase family protein [Pseudomonadota bacterium]